MTRTIAALLLAATALGACNNDQANRLEQALTGLPPLGAEPAPPSGLVDIPVPAPELEVSAPQSEPEPVAEIPAPPAVEPPAPESQYGDAGYVCEPIFRVRSCDDDGRPHDLGPNMEWLN